MAIANFKFSVPGSAWDRTAVEALPRFAPDSQGKFSTAGGACPAARSQAEPGNEKICNLQFSICNFHFSISPHGFAFQPAKPDVELRHAFSCRPAARTG